MPPARKPLVRDGCHRNTNLADGQRVRVSILTPSRYAHGCAEKLDGKAGIIERRKDSSSNSLTGFGPAYLVKFDEPAECWYSYGTPHEAFWFDPCDLIEIRS